MITKYATYYFIRYAKHDEILYNHTMFFYATLFSALKLLYFTSSRLFGQHILMHVIFIIFAAQIQNRIYAELKTTIHLNSFIFQS